MKTPDQKLPGRWLYAAGGGFTVVYMGLFVWYCWVNWAKFKGLEPNAVGDFLAGSFSPLAFAWLVLGFIQQGIELRQNSDALLLQRDELQRAAAHAGTMVELHKQQLDDARAKEAAARRELEERKAAETQMLQKKQAAAARERVQPDFYFTVSRADGDLNGSVLALENDGRGCTDVKLVFENVADVIKLIGPAEFAEFPGDLEQDVKFAWWVPGPAVHPLEITFTDEQGARGVQKFNATLANGRLDVKRVRRWD